MQDPALWASLKDHPLPVTGRRKDLESLATGFGGLGRKMTRVVLQEYRRFLYLAAIAGPEVVPPPLIHQVWQLHARDHANYTEKLVRGVIGRRMPEAFDAPRPLSDPAHVRTRALYRQEFGAAAPAAIWPGPMAMLAGQGLHWATIGFAGLAVWLLLSREVAWAATAVGCSLACVLLRSRATPWTFRKRDNGIDLDFGANDRGGGGLDLFGD